MAAPGPITHSKAHLFKGKAGKAEVVGHVVQPARTIDLGDPAGLAPVEPVEVESETPVEIPEVKPDGKEAQTESQPAGVDQTPPVDGKTSSPKRKKAASKPPVEEPEPSDSIPLRGRR